MAVNTIHNIHLIPVSHYLSDTSDASEFFTATQISGSFDQRPHSLLAFTPQSARTLASMSEHRNSSPYSQRRAQTYETHAGGTSADPYDGVEASRPNAKQTMANRAQSVRDSSKCGHDAPVGKDVTFKSNYLA